MTEANDRPILKPADFRRLSKFIEDELGIRMPDIKKVMLESRLHKRLRILSINNYSDYCDFLFSDEGLRKELPFMIDVVTTNKTDFFREPDHFVYMENDVIIPLLQKKDIPVHLDLWSSASSTGEEVYTLSMVLNQIRFNNSNFSFTILGSDISQEVLQKARRGVYHKSRIDNIPLSQKKMFFLKSRDSNSEDVKVKAFLQENVQFKQLNLMNRDYGINRKFHIIFCRNVLIYFPQEKQKKILMQLYNHLHPGGYLFLGHSETITGLDLPYISVAPTIYLKPIS
ncbi:MAG: hypothetical protein B6241_05475 [Spirochaetaceae bacterium 4572_59]|nr:MAG: hypothetical protein B6241_05475 [Spirochaetaceae bacterium 4572_59]